MLANEADLTPDRNTPTARLADEYGASERALDRMGEATREAFLEHLERAEEIGDTEGLLAERELERHFEEAEALLADSRVSAARLFDAYDSDDENPRSAELSAALSEGTDVDDVEPAGSDRVKRAQLQDELEETEARLSEASHPFLEYKLEGERDEIEARLAELEG
jgi:hypothetical protein